MWPGQLEDGVRLVAENLSFICSPGLRLGVHGDRPIVASMLQTQRALGFSMPCGAVVVPSDQRPKRSRERPAVHLREWEFAHSQCGRIINEKL